MDQMEVGLMKVGFLPGGKPSNLGGEMFVPEKDVPVFGFRDIEAGRQVLSMSMAAALAGEQYSGFMIHYPTLIQLFPGPHDFSEWLLSMEINPQHVKGKEHCMFVHYQWDRTHAEHAS